MKTCCLMTNMIQTFCDTNRTFCVTIPIKQGFFLRAKKWEILVCPYGQLCQLIFYTCLTRVEIRITEIPDLKTTKLSMNTPSDADVVDWR